MSMKPLKRSSPISVGQLHYYHTDFYYSMPNLNNTRKMHGVKRVLVFCILIVIIPATLIIIPLYLRKFVFADVIYPVAESDIIEIRDGISSIFCEQHTLHMTNSNFNAFQIRNRPEISPHRKHIKLKKSMTLPDDTLEYWGFYLLKGAKVQLKFCSLFDGSKILVVKGHRELELCGLLDHNKKKNGANYAKGHEQVRVFFEEITELEQTVPSDVLAPETTDVNDSDNIEENENHGGEDLSGSVADKEEDALQLLTVAKNLTINNLTYNITDARENLTKLDKNITETTTTTTTTTRGPHKKLKKGTLHRQHKKASSAEVNTTAFSNSNSLTPEQDFELDNIPLHTYSSSSSGISLKNSNQQRRKRSHNTKENAYLRAHRAAHAHAQRKQAIYDQLYRNSKHTKRDAIYDRKYSHGGNAINFTEADESNSVSSFETGLLACFKGETLLLKGFNRSAECNNTNFLENGKHRMVVTHDVIQDGYYYYIFYSDNDEVRNDIHAIFDIYKPTFQYSNLSNSQACVNATNCTFPIGFLSDEIVVVEVPTRDGIEHEEDDITYLISTCHPRTEIYALFPIMVLILILSCSFL